MPITRRNVIASFPASVMAASGIFPFRVAQAQNAQLDFNDIQYLVMARVPALTGRYEFLTFRQPAAGRSWLAGIIDKVASVQQARQSIEREQRWVSVAFTWAGLRALGIDE